MTVPPSTKIRPRSLPNVDTDRLQQRLAFLRQNGPAMARAADGRKQVRDLARQILQIQQELDRRN
jgi:hypothetical protein